MVDPRIQQQLLMALAQQQAQQQVAQPQPSSTFSGGGMGPYVGGMSGVKGDTSYITDPEQLYPPPRTSPTRHPALFYEPDVMDAPYVPPPSMANPGVRTEGSTPIENRGKQRLITRGAVRY